MGSLGSYVICHWSLVIGHLLMGEMFVVTTSVVASLLGGSQVTP